MSCVRSGARGAAPEAVIAHVERLDGDHEGQERRKNAEQVVRQPHLAQRLQLDHLSRHKA